MAKGKPDYDKDNLEAARIMLADPERYAGSPLEWAKLWMAKHERKSEPESNRQPASATAIAARHEKGGA
jgi:hypothetical protein